MLMKLKLAQAVLLAVLLLLTLFAPDAMAAAPVMAQDTDFGDVDTESDSGSGSNIFGSFLATLVGWLTGALGKLFAIALFAIGAGYAVARQNLLFIAGGVGMALMMAFGPSLILSVFSATLPVAEMAQVATQIAGPLG